MQARQMCWLLVALTFMMSAAMGSQYYDTPDSGQPGDGMIQKYLAQEAGKEPESFLNDIQSRDHWEEVRPRYKDEYLYMLGLSPLPEKTSLNATVTGEYQGNGFVVEMLHYESRPGLYVTANLYRPSDTDSAKRLPAVLYVCGHSSRGRNGGKTAFQSHGIWFAKHGYVCMIVDTLQLGEIAATHHGTYNLGRFWWHSRGYTPAGVECWNGIRGIDYLVSRSDVDPERIAVTGISGGGAATFWIAAADERVRVAVPVSGMADLVSYVPNRVINGHCDCMFLYNTFQWPWTRIAALIAPRPLLFVNSDQDSIFPMDANERVINRLERLYSLYGAGDVVDSVVSVGGHAYRKDIRQAAYRFINTYLKDDPRPITDSEADLVDDSSGQALHPIDPEKLRVFPDDANVPRDQLNTTIDQHFVRIAKVELAPDGQFDSWRRRLMDELRSVSFGCLPDRVPSAEKIAQDADERIRLRTEPGITISLKPIETTASAADARRVLLYVRCGDDSSPPVWLKKVNQEGDRVYELEPRGIGSTRWTEKNPPNYVLRSHVLLGRTVDNGRVWDIIAAARYLNKEFESKVPIYVLGEKGAGVLGAYAALWESDIDGVILISPPLTHMESAAPQFLNVLRVCDIPEVLGMLAPRTLVVYAGENDRLRRVEALYNSAGASKSFESVNQ